MADQASTGDWTARARSIATAPTAERTGDGENHGWFLVDFARDHRERLGASALEALGAETSFARFVTLAADVLDRLRSVHDLIDSEPFVADDQFMATRPLLAELFMYRSVSDSVGLIALKCMQASSTISAVTEARNTIDAMIRALSRIHQAPHLQFNEACALAEVIEDAVSSPLKAVGYDELASELISAAEG